MTAPLNAAQVGDYRSRGWVVLPDVFSTAEVEVLEDAALTVMDRPGPEVGREADGSPHVCWECTCSTNGSKL